MKRILMIVCMVLCLSIQVSAAEITVPLPPEDAVELLPMESESFGRDLWRVIKAAIGKLQPELSQAFGMCLALFATVMILSTVNSVPGNTGKTTELVGVLASSILLLSSARTMVILAGDTVRELSEYGKLLLPVMASALAAQGGVTAASTLYVGTAVFDSVLCGFISKVLVPLVYIYLTLVIVAATAGEELIKNLRDMVRSFVTWCLKTALYIFTAYIGITGVVSGTTDAAAMKAAKLTISGMIPVVGGILSDASEAVIVGAGVMKNSVGVYGMLAIVAIWIAPFLRIGAQYLLLKLTAALCAVFELKPVKEVISGFGNAMGLLLGMTGAVGMLLLVSMVCFMKGVS